MQKMLYCPVKLKKRLDQSKSYLKRIVQLYVLLQDT
jgi:hypothetical protein